MASRRLLFPAVGIFLVRVSGLIVCIIVYLILRSSTLSYNEKLAMLIVMLVAACTLLIFYVSYLRPRRERENFNFKKTTQIYKIKSSTCGKIVKKCNPTVTR